MLAGFDDEGVKAEHQLAAARLDQLRSEKIGVGPHDLWVEIGKEFRRREEGPFEFGHAMNFELADMGRLHLPLRVSCARKA